MACSSPPSDALEDRIRELIQESSGLTGVVLDCAGINFVDSQGSAKLGDIVELCEQAGTTLRLARVKPVRPRRPGARRRRSERIGTDHVHGNVHRAVEAQQTGS